MSPRRLSDEERAQLRALLEDDCAALRSQVDRSTENTERALAAAERLKAENASLTEANAYLRRLVDNPEDRIVRLKANIDAEREKNAPLRERVTELTTTAFEAAKSIDEALREIEYAWEHERKPSDSYIEPRLRNALALLLRAPLPSANRQPEAVRAEKERGS